MKQNKKTVDDLDQYIGEDDKPYISIEKGDKVYFRMKIKYEKLLKDEKTVKYKNNKEKHEFESADKKLNITYENKE